MTRRLLLMLLMLCACRGRQVPAVQPDAIPRPSDRATGVSTSVAPSVVTPGGQTVWVEIASNEQTRERGLMFRDTLDPDHGMLFIFSKTEIYPFWMKNTLIPLDMVWIDAAHKVVAIRAAVPPCPGDPCPSFSPEVPALYVLELRAGQAAALRLRVGDSVTIRGTEAYRVE